MARKPKPRKVPNSKYSIYYIEPVEKRIVISAPSIAEAKTLAKKKLGKLKIVGAKVHTMYF